MSDLILRNTVRAQSTLHSIPSAARTLCHRAAERFRREQTGQDMVEYGGVLLVVAIIVAAVAASPIGTTISTNVTTLVNDVFSGTRPPTKP